MGKSFNSLASFSMSFLAAAALAAAAQTQAAPLLNVRALDRPRLVKAADKFLSDAPQTLTAFPAPRSAGGLHDFFSEGDYWWPDPANPDGPYIQKDGMTNPDNFVKHRQAMITMNIEVATLTGAYRVSGEEKYARQAIKHLQAWFVDEKTRMNPNLMYAQAIKGRATGRSTGIIDTIHLIEVARSATVLGKAGLLQGADLAGVKKWFADYLKWLTTSDRGLEEMKTTNNHATCWAMQVAEFAAMTGDQAQLAAGRKQFKEVLLPKQLAADGSFPAELKRTKPYGYSLFNLDAMATLCQVLSTPQDNLWEFTLPDGRNMHQAAEYMYPFIKDKSKWPLKPDVMFWEFWPVRSPALLFPGVAYGDAKYLDLWKTLDADPTNEEVLRNLPVRTPVLWVEP